MIEVTGSQTISISVGGELDFRAPASIKTYRDMRKDPVIALGRALSTAPIVAGEWSYEEKEGAHSEARQFIEETFEPLRDAFIEQALLGGLDFGWQGFEKVFEMQGERVTLVKLKALLIDLTVILVEETSGVFAGFRQNQITVPVEQSLLVSFRVEGTDWRGNSLLENVREVYNQWIEANDGAARYDKKMAGSHWVIYYPVGSADYDGTVTDNAKIAATMAKALRSSSILTIPLDFKQLVPGQPENAKIGWRIELISDQSARQVSFIPRLEYLDRMKIRGLHFPERAILEGKFGTKAEAGVHQDLALSYAELQHQRLTAIINRECVDQLLALNFGQAARGTVIIKASPLVNAKLAFLQEVFKEILKADTAETIANVDHHSLRTAVGIPEVEEPTAEPGLENVERVKTLLDIR